MVRSRKPTQCNNGCSEKRNIIYRLETGFPCSSDILLAKAETGKLFSSTTCMEKITGSKKNISRQNNILRKMPNKNSKNPNYEKTNFYSRDCLYFFDS